jgi:hypothetical protein
VSHEFLPAPIGYHLNVVRKEASVLLSRVTRSLPTLGNWDLWFFENLSLVNPLHSPWVPTAPVRE